MNVGLITIFLILYIIEDNDEENRKNTIEMNREIQNFIISLKNCESEYELDKMEKEYGKVKKYARTGVTYVAISFIVCFFLLIIWLDFSFERIEKQFKKIGKLSKKFLSEENRKNPKLEQNNKSPELKIFEDFEREIEKYTIKKLNSNK